MPVDLDRKGGKDAEPDELKYFGLAYLYVRQEMFWRRHILLILFLLLLLELLTINIVQPDLLELEHAVLQDLHIIIINAF